MTWRNVLVLSLCQAAGLSGLSALILLGGIIGTDLAPSPALATLPISLSVVGVAVSSIPAALFMKQVGRRAGFTASAALAAAGGLLAAYAVSRGNFLLFCIGAVLIGMNGAFMQQYRFAASESVPERSVSRAVSLVLLGGLAAGFLGPELAQRTQDWLPSAPYAGSFVSVAVLFGFAALIMLGFYRDRPVSQLSAAGPERRLRAVVTQPLFFVAVLGAAVAYGVMTFLMTATPIQLHTHEGFTLDQTTLVIQSHIIAMYLPSFFTGFLLERLGLLRVLIAGAACMLAASLAGLVSFELLHYGVTLVLLGLGWNFLFVGSTVMLTRTYRPAERFKAQAVNDFTVFAVQATASLSAGTLLFLTDWRVLTLTSLLPLVLIVAVLFTLRRQVAPPVETPGRQLIPATGPAKTRARTLLRIVQRGRR